jgi:ankyrin repeat protein
MVKKLVCMTLALLGMSINLNVHGGNTSSTERHLNNEAAEHNTNNLKQRLINAVLGGYVEITRLLLPRVNLSIEDLNTGLRTSYDNDKKDILSLLISHIITHYPNKRIEDEYLKTAFTHAVNNNFAHNDLKDLVIAILSNNHANASIDDRAIEDLFERAVRIDDENFIGHLLSNSRCQMVIKRTHEKNLILHVAHGNAEALGKFLATPQINLTNTTRRALALKAARTGDTKLLCHALNIVPDINVKNNEGLTTLMLAAKNGHTKTVVRLLHVPGINVNAQTTESTNIPQGITALMIAAGAGHKEIVERLLQVPGINANAVQNNGDTALILAANNGHEDTVRMFLHAPGIDVNAVLIDAASAGKTAAVRMILASDKIQVGLKNNLTQINLAYDKAYNLPYGHAGRSECIALLSDAISKINTLDRDLQNAAYDGKTEEVSKLLLAGANVNATNLWSGSTALIYAVYNGHIDIVRKLLAAPGINVHEKDWRDKTALTHAFSQGHIEIAKLLLAVPGIGRRECTALTSSTISQINTLDRDLRHAARDNQTAEVSRLLLAGADVNARSLWSCSTALIYATYNGHIDIVRQLLAAPGINVNKEDWVNRTALTHAFSQGHIEIAKLLLAVPGIKGEAALRDAAEYGHIEKVRLLLAVPGIDVNEESRSSTASLNGLTALGNAAANGHTEVVRLLLAVPGIKNVKGALRAAVFHNHIEIARLLFAVPGINFDADFLSDMRIDFSPVNFSHGEMRKLIREKLAQCAT